jgi:hypothetical protein
MYHSDLSGNIWIKLHVVEDFIFLKLVPEILFL